MMPGMYPFGYMPHPDPLENYKRMKEFVDSLKPKEDKKPKMFDMSDHMIMVVGVYSILWIVTTLAIMSYATTLINATHHL